MSDDCRIGWEIAYGQRHVVVHTPSGKWILCNLKGTPPRAGAPCPVCFETVDELVRGSARVGS